MTGKYGIFIYWSDEDRVYIAEVPDLPGCITHGDTRSNALANAIEAIELWVETANEFNKSIPEPRTQHSGTTAAQVERSRTKEGRKAVPPLQSRRKNQPKHYYDIGSQPVTNPRAR